MKHITFGTIMEWYLDFLGTRPSAMRYGKIYEKQFEGTELAKRPAHLVTLHDILLYKQEHEHAPAQCRKALQLITQAYNWASVTIDRESRKPLYDGQNPAARVKKPSNKSRERLMDKFEIRMVLEGIDFLNLNHRAFMTCRLLTPCRILELCQMKRADVDLNTGKWFKRFTKTGRPQFTLIPRQALELLRKLPVKSDYFFTGHYGRPMQRESLRKVWGVLRSDLRMPDVQLLDFRRTLASYLYTEVKADDLTVKAVLNHYDGRPVAIYTRLNFDQIAELIQRYADWIWALKATAPVEPVHSMPCEPREAIASLGQTTHQTLPA